MIDGIKLKRIQATNRDRLLKELTKTICEHSMSANNSVALFNKYPEHVGKMFNKLQPFLNDLVKDPENSNGDIINMSLLLIFIGSDVLANYLTAFEESDKV